MAESKFNKRFRSELSEFPYKFRFYRVESHSTEPGMSDNHFLREGYSGWIEVKQEEKMPRRIDYRPAQPAWLLSYWLNGGACGTVLHIRSTDTLVLVRGCDTLQAAAGDLGKVAQIVALGKEGAWGEVADWIMGLEHAGKGRKSQKRT